MLSWMSPVLLCRHKCWASAFRCTWRLLHQSRQLWDLTTHWFWSDNSQTLAEAARGCQRQGYIQLMYSLCDPTVMQCGTMHSPAAILGYINDTLPEGSNAFSSTHFNNVWLFSLSEDEPIRYFIWVMQFYLEDGLQLNPEQHNVHNKIVKLFSLIVSTKGISIGQHKVETVSNCNMEKRTANGRLNYQFKLQQLLCLYNYSKSFFPRYSAKAIPLIRSIHKYQPFKWESQL